MSSDRSHRREFLGQLSTGALAIVGTACVSASPSAKPETAPTPTSTGGRPGAVPSTRTQPWDDTWVARLTAAHRAVFDSPGIEDGMAIQHVSGYLNAMKVIHDADAQAVLVIRHQAIPMVFNDAMWAKYGVGKLAQLADGSRNPYGQRITALGARVIVLGCDQATRNFTGRMASGAGGDRTAVYEEVKANLLPGVILQPTGVYAVHRAQEGGCTMIRST